MLAFKIRMLLGFILFILLIDVYLWQGLRRLMQNSSPLKKKVIKWVHWTIPLIFIACTLLYLFSPLETNKYFRNYFMGLFFVTYFSKLIALPFLFTDDIRRSIIWLRRIISRKDSAKAEPAEVSAEKISRSKFITQAGIITSAAPFVVLSRSIFKGAHDYRVHHIPLLLPNLPDRFAGLKIAQISDIHSGSFFDKDKVKKGVDLLVAQKPDVVFFTGDMVNMVAEEVNDYMDLFSMIKAPMGVYSTLGNHDYGDYVSNWESPAAKQKNLDDLCRAHKDLGWRLLRNEHETISIHGQKLGIIGVENWGDRGRFQKYGNIEKAEEGMEEVPVKLLLSHDPSHWDEVVRKGHPDIDVMFSGHTHGMQFGIEAFGIKWSPIQYMYKQWAGLYEKDHQRLYVNRGFGFIGFPGRVGILPEISLFTLQKS